MKVGTGKNVGVVVTWSALILCSMRRCNCERRENIGACLLFDLQKRGAGGARTRVF